MALCNYSSQLCNDDQSCQECRKILRIAKRKVNNKMVREGHELRQWVAHVNLLDVVLPICEDLDRLKAEEIIKATAERLNLVSIKHDLQPHEYDPPATEEPMMQQDEDFTNCISSLDLQHQSKVTSNTGVCPVIVVEEIDEWDD